MAAENSGENPIISNRKITETTLKEQGPDNEQVIDLEDSNVSREIPYIGERNALIFPVSSQNTQMNDFPDDFFELSMDEVKNIYTELKRDREMLEQKPLMTNFLRKQNELLNMQAKLKKYNFSVIRIQFPDLIVLQGFFEPNETVQNVMDFVCLYLEDPNTSFYLYTTPPKNILKPEKCLIDVDCFPTAKVYFGLQGVDSSNKCFLKENLKKNLTDYETANSAAARNRTDYATCKRPEETKKVFVPMPKPYCDDKASSSQQKELEDCQHPSSTTSHQIKRKSLENKIPKWFKK